LLYLLKNNFYLIFILVGISFHSISQEKQAVSVNIALWYQGKPGAVSISFDDASYTQYTSAYPILAAYGIKGTFSVVGEWTGEDPVYTAEPGSFEIKKMGWAELIELAENGHELAAHGYYHEKYNKNLDVADLVVDMKQIKDLIEFKTDRKVFTLNYPYSYASGNIPLAAAEVGYLFGRTGLDTINPPSPPDRYLLATQAILNQDDPDSILFRKWVDRSKDNWLILMYHHFFTENSKEMEIIRLHNVKNSYSVPPDVFEMQIKVLVKAGYWIAPICEIGKYIMERDNTEIRTVETEKKIHIFTFTNLDKNIYDHPLTIEAKLPWNKVKVEGSLCDGIFQTNDSKLYIDVLPETELILSKEQ
jgi:peptidoglycan/xylan/chitin deacetylase (PgdA/CDA1 family)